MGLLCAVLDAADHARAMERMIEMSARSATGWRAAG